jgi:pimeloyl-ACP methyl ester carboxylesterase
MNEFVRTYARRNAWRGTEGLYQALFSDEGATKALAEAHPIAVPVLAIDGASYPFTENTFRQVTAGEITAAHIQNVGHLVAQEAPTQLAGEILEFTGHVDAD